MGVKDLRILFRFCNVAGLFPFRMVTNDQTNGFQRFDSHWRHPANWWFLILFFIDIAYIIVTIYEQIFQFIFENKLVTIYKVVYTLSILNYTLLVTVPRLFLFSFRHLETALEILNDIDRLLLINTNENVPYWRTKQRTILGIVASLIWMMVLNGAMLPVVEKWDIYNAVLRILKLSVVTLQICTWLTTFHACYYNLSYRIHVLVKKLTADETLSSATSQHEPTKRKVRTCAYIFDKISLVATELKTAFSLSVLLILTLQMIICSCSLFFCIYSYYYTLLPERIYIFGALFSFSVISIIIIITTVESPVTQMTCLREKLLEMSIDDGIHPDLLFEEASFIASLSADRIQLTAGGLFTVGMQSIPTWISAVITYLVVFIQSTMSKDAV